MASPDVTKLDLLADSLTLIAIPAGAIVMRDERLRKSWQVDIAPLRLARVPVTQALYHAVTGENPSAFSGPDLPVESVSWLDAIRFCNRLSRMAGLPESYTLHDEGMGADLISNADGYRLPSEAEWEYSCRAGTTTPRYGDLDDIAWYHGNSGGHPHEVGVKQPNAWGLHDMLGNVWEWCSDQYDPQVYGSYRVFRGGGWADHERGCLAMNRRRSHPTFAIDDLGFRLARSVL